MKKNKEDREVFFDNQAYFSNPMMAPPFQASSYMYYNPNMYPFNNQSQQYNTYDNMIEQRVNKLERVVRKLEEKVLNLEKKADLEKSTYQSTNNNYSNSDTYMV